MKKSLLFRICLGLLISFTFLSCEKQDPEPEEPALKLSNISPYSGYEGDTINIYGIGFSATETENKVSFNDLEAPIITAAEGKLEVVVPDGATTGKITVTVGEHTIKSGISFVVLPKPSIESFNPPYGYEGDDFVISGANFSAEPLENVVRLNGLVLPVISASTTKLTVKIPEGATSGKITVKVNGQPTINNLEQEFEVFHDFWSMKAGFPGATHHEGVGFSIGDKGYVGLGFSGNGMNQTLLKEFWEYNPATDSWTQIANLPGPARERAVAFGIGGKGYVGTGRASIENKSVVLADFWEYDPSTNSWTQKADFGGGPDTRSTAFSIGSKGYVFNGKEVWEYDPGLDVWNRKKDNPGNSIGEAAGFAIGNKGYIGTGYLGANNVKDFWEYDPATDSWTQKADFGGGARKQAVGFAIGDKGYICTGDADYGIDGNVTRTRKDVWEYDPDKDTWARKRDTESGLNFGSVSFVIDGKGYLCAGFFDHTRKLWEYTPD